MSNGPKIIAVAAGDALSVTPINSNFTAIQDFLTAVPVDNLEKYYCPNQMGGSLYDDSGVGTGTTLYGAYFQPEQSGSDATRLKAIQCSLVASAALQAGDSVVFTIEERTSTGPSVWSAISGSTVTIDNSTTAEDSTGAATLLYWLNDAASAGTDLNASRLHRFKAVVTLGGGRTVGLIQAVAFGRTKLQAG